MNQTRSIPEDQLDPVRTFRAEDINCAREWIFTERLAHQRRQPIRPPAKVNRLRRNQNPQARRNRDHAAAFNARSTSVRKTRSTPGSA